MVYFDKTQFIESNVFSKCFSWSVVAAAWDCFNIVIYHLLCLLSFCSTLPSGRAIKDSSCGRSAGLFCQTIFEKEKKCQLIKDKWLIDHVRTRRNEKAVLNLPLAFEILAKMLLRVPLWGIKLRVNRNCGRGLFVKQMPFADWVHHLHIWWAFFFCRKSFSPELSWY